MSEADLGARTPPHSAEAERGVLGSILIDTESDGNTRILDACQAQGITGEAFFVPKNRILFETLVKMSRDSQPLDPVTVSTQLHTDGHLDQVGGMEFLRELIVSTPTAAHAEYWMKIVRDKALLRTIIRTAREAEAKCYDPDQSSNVDILSGEVEKSFMDLGGGSTSQRLDWRSAIQKTHEHIEHCFDQKHAVEGLPTGFTALDDKLSGMKPGDMIVLAARPSMGKTSLAMNIAECVATGTNIDGYKFNSDKTNQKHPVLIFSLEMSTEALAHRMLCGRAQLNPWRLQRGLLNEEERSAATSNLFTASDELAKAPIYVDDTSGLDVMDMRARARRMKRTHGIELIVIDYLQLCNCREYAKQGRQLETSRISNQIKAMAKELAVPVIVLSQLSRANEQRNDKDEAPKLSDLRDSGAIEQDADVVMLLRRPCRTKSAQWHDNEFLAIVDVAKFRNGQTGEVDFNFYGDLTRFGNRRQGREARATPLGEPVDNAETAEAAEE